MVEEVAAEMKAEIKDRNVEWRIGELPDLACDPGLMKVVFINLLSNAVKYSRGKDPAVVEIGQCKSGDELALFVRDNGVGFDMSHADKLFGVFQRLHKAEDFEGTGVGLAIVSRIIRKHGGRIWAEGQVDKGATFYFTIGVVPPPAG
jgi:two-component system, chemotaxis family, sensor kinase Cph1